MVQGAIILISIEDIHILNPRVRNQIIAEEIRQNIRSVGLKRPITVSPRNDAKSGKKYDLVCGQGRLEAYISAGETEIPCVVRKVSEEDAHIMSLVENMPIPKFLFIKISLILLYSGSIPSTKMSVKVTKKPGSYTPRVVRVILYA